MADRTVQIVYASRGVGSVVAGANAIGNAHVRASNQMAGAQARVASASRAVATVAAVAAKVILFGVGAAFAVSAKAAMDFESSMAGVFKTLGDTASATQILALGEALRSMSLVIPVNVNELAYIAELGGQLGVGIEDMEHFTRTIAALSVTTNLSSADAAKGLARLSNILELPIKDVDRLGNVIVDLGNNFAATESEILTFALRLAPIGKTIGASADEILGMAAAFTSLGIPAERGATAIQRTFIQIERAVADGGSEMERFAHIVGVTSDEFVKMTAVDRFVGFIEGLRRIQDEGGSAFVALSKLNISQQRSIQVLLAAAGAGDLLADAIEKGGQAAESNNALWEEAARRYGTTESQIKLLVNSFNDLRIELGQGVLPWIQRAIDIFRDFISVLKENADGLKTIAKVLLMFVLVKTIIALVFGLSKAFVALNTAFIFATGSARGFIGAMGVASAVLGVLNIALGVAALAFGAFMFAQTKAAGETRELEAAVKSLNDEIDEGANVSHAWYAVIAEALGEDKGLRHFFIDAGISFSYLSDAILGLNGASIEAVTARMQDFVDTADEADLAALEVLGGGDFKAGSPEAEAGHEIGDAIRARNALLDQAGVFIEDYADLEVARVEDREYRIKEAMLDAARDKQAIARQHLIDINTINERGFTAPPLSAIDVLGQTDEGEKELQDAFDFLTDTTDAMYENVQDFFDKTREEIYGSISIWDKYPRAVRINVNKVITNLRRQADDIVAWNDTLSTMIAMGVSGNVIAAFDEFDLQTKAGITRLMKKSPKAFATFIEGFEEEFSRIDAASIIKAMLFDPIGKEMAIFVQNAISELGKVGGGGAGFEVFASDIEEKFSTSGQLGKDALMQFLNEMDSEVAAAAFGISVNMWDSFILGMNNRLPATIEQIKGGTDRIIAAWKDRFEEGSPSKVFMRIGENAIKGFNIGMAQGMDWDLRGLDRHIGTFRQAAFTQAVQPKAPSEINNNQATTVVIKLVTQRPTL